jgi:mannose-6-phosphate isomerase
MYLLGNEARHYDWGSRTAIPEFLGARPDGRAHAEWWVGAHPLGPSLVVDLPENPALPDVIATSPEELLGAHVVGTFGPRLPFLLKVIAPAKPLSIQVHPHERAAQLGFEADERQQTDAGPPTNRTYLDPFHKPEMVVALTPFDMLCGFRSPVDAASTLELFDHPVLAQCARTLRDRALDDASRVRAAFARLSELDDEAGAELSRFAAGRAHEILLADAHWSAEHGVSAFEPRLTAINTIMLETILEVAGHFPGDRGVVLALLLNRARLRPGEAAFVEPGVIHCYLGGLGVEIMAASDNVLRAGLTPKHVDVQGVLALTSFQPERMPRLEPKAENGALVFAPPVKEFQLCHITVGPHGSGAEHDAVTCDGTGPRLALVTDGHVTLSDQAGSLSCPRGTAVFVPHAAGQLTVTGHGEVMVGSVPRPAASPAP